MLEVLYFGLCLVCFDLVVCFVEDVWGIGDIELCGV